LIKAGAARRLRRVSSLRCGPRRFILQLLALALSRRRLCCFAECDI
jgi:hypothetical protein